jgi:protein-tyrosine phosphatase
MKTVLFLCTGNYYRSRFAEIVFNIDVLSTSLLWEATSRALALERGINNLGQISIHVQNYLDENNLKHVGEDRYPVQCTEQDLQQASRIIALKEMEHRPLLAQRFPLWENRVEYWHVDDLDFATSQTALPLIKEKVKDLLDQLSRNSG